MRALMGEAMGDEQPPDGALDPQEKHHNAT